MLVNENKAMFQNLNLNVLNANKYFEIVVFKWKRIICFIEEYKIFFWRKKFKAKKLCEISIKSISEIISNIPNSSFRNSSNVNAFPLVKSKDYFKACYTLDIFAHNIAK